MKRTLISRVVRRMLGKRDAPTPIPPKYQHFLQGQKGPPFPMPASAPPMPRIKPGAPPLDFPEIDSSLIPLKEKQ